MIRLRDATVLAYTKLRVHKVRTGITVGVAGILFGILFGGVFIAQGIFESVDRFNEEGLASRSIIALTKYDSGYFDIYEKRTDDAFVAEVKQAHADRVAQKTAAAKKYGIEYDPRVEDFSPIEVNKESGKERIGEHAFGSALVEEVSLKQLIASREVFDVATFLERYKSARVIEGTHIVQTHAGTISVMKDGKEGIVQDRQEDMRQQSGRDEEMPAIQVLNESITTPFIVEDAPSVAEGELPGIVSFSYAEKLLGLKSLAKDSTSEQKMARLQEVRQRIGEVTASFCYRNIASQGLLNQAVAQRDEIERGKTNRDYREPSLVYALPAEESCGAVTIAKDTRTAEEKRLDSNLEAYQREIGDHPGNPEQHKITLRAIGLSGDAFGSGMSGSAGELVTSLLGSWLYYGPVWTIPADRLAKAPEALRPPAVFEKATSGSAMTTVDAFAQNTYLIEFSDLSEARALLTMTDSTAEDIFVSPFGSGMLIVDQARQWFSTALMWALTIVGGVALVILASLIGRMVSDGRRESAVFRAIGAKRIDIGSIYGIYALLLSLRVALFSLILGLVISLAIEVWLAADATLGARLAYAAADTTASLHFIGINSWYVLMILAAIVAAGLVASIVPILLGARRNPITDMRDE